MMREEEKKPRNEKSLNHKIKDFVGITEGTALSTFWTSLSVKKKKRKTITEWRGGGDARTD